MSSLTAAFLPTVLCLLCTGTPDARALTEESLDKPITATVDETPIADAFDLLADKADVGIAIKPESLDLLPYGDRTRVSARLDEVPLREALSAICAQVGMEIQTTARGVEVVPSPGLRRLGRPATWDEIGLLSALMQQEVGTVEDVDALLAPVRFEGMEERHPTSLLAQLRRPIEHKIRAFPSRRGDEALTDACWTMRCTWYPWGKSIIVLPVRAQFKRQLQRPVSLHIQERPLGEALEALSTATGVVIRVDSGAAAVIPDQTKRRFSLLAEGITGADALAQIALATSLEVKVNDGGVLLKPTAAPLADRAMRRVDPIVGKVVVPSEGGSYAYEWIIRQSDLTAEQNAHREKIVAEAVKKMTPSPQP